MARAGLMTDAAQKTKFHFSQSAKTTDQVFKEQSPSGKKLDMPANPFLGGARRDRTADLLLAKQALSRLSYGPEPTVIHEDGGSGWIRTTDLTLIRGAL